MWLVTGAAGHIGNVLLRTLAQKRVSVRALLMPGESRASIEDVPAEIVDGDVLDPRSLLDAVRGATGVYHLAGRISIMPGADAAVHRVNVEGTNNLLQAMEHCGVDRLVYTSSIHAIRRVETGIIDERLPFDPQNPYGEYDRSKAEATLGVLRAAQHGMHASIVCPTGVIGPYDFRNSMMGAVIRTAALSKPSLYVDGAYDFVDVRDVAQGIAAAAERGRDGESYILSGQRITVRTLLETVRSITGRHFPILRIPGRLASLIARLAPLYYRLSGAVPRFTPYSMEVLRSNCRISHAKATRELAYHPRPLADSIADTVRWFASFQRSAGRGLA